jgi:hypothetical protein
MEHCTHVGEREVYRFSFIMGRKDYPHHQAMTDRWAAQDRERPRDKKCPCRNDFRPKTLHISEKSSTFAVEIFV